MKPFCTVEELHRIYIECQNKVCTDSRNIVQGSIFFCLKGPSFNGNKFALEALEKGAAFAVADEAEFAVQEKVLLVENALDALQNLARMHRSALKTHILGIGGSNGKTTTKELCLAVADHALKATATTGNLNNHIGVPLTLLGLKGNEDLAIVEMGTNHPGEMNVLCDITNPDSGIITNIGKEHLEGFGDLEGVALEESALYEKLNKNGGRAFVNLDDTWLRSMSGRLQNCFTYAINQPADLQGIVLESMPKLQFRLIYKSEIFGPYQSGLGGTYNFYNILSAIAMGISMGLGVHECAQKAAAYRSSNNRSEWLKRGKTQILLDAYNANPSSMEATLREFALLPGRKSVFLGDMLEMGDFSEAEHAAIFDLCKTLHFNDMFFSGAEFAKVTGSYPMQFPDSLALAAWLKSNPGESDYVLIKGSRGARMERILEAMEGREGQT